jgi:GDP-4-dehydro-6-deoxy-D-mannose reductase
VGLGLQRIAPDFLDEYHQIDLTDAVGIRNFVNAQPRPDRVFHLAGLLPPASEAEMWRVNVGGTLNLLLALAKSGGHLRVLTVGSAAEYIGLSDQPLRENHPVGGGTRYGRAKWAQTALALAVGAQTRMKVMVARTFNLIGPGTPRTLVPGALCAQFAAGRKEIKVGNLDSERDFVDVRDAVSAYWAICEKGRAGAVYNVCAGQAVRVGTLAALFSRLDGKGRKVRQELSGRRRQELNCNCGDNSRLRQLGWHPEISLQRSVRDMLAQACQA